MVPKPKTLVSGSRSMSWMRDVCRQRRRDAEGSLHRQVAQRTLPPNRSICRPPSSVEHVVLEARRRNAAADGAGEGRPAQSLRQAGQVERVHAQAELEARRRPRPAGACQRRWSRHDLPSSAAIAHGLREAQFAIRAAEARSAPRPGRCRTARRCPSAMRLASASAPASSAGRRRCRRSVKRAFGSTALTPCNARVEQRDCAVAHRRSACRLAGRARRSEKPAGARKPLR